MPLPGAGLVGLPPTSTQPEKLTQNWPQQRVWVHSRKAGWFVRGQHTRDRLPSFFSFNSS